MITLPNGIDTPRVYIPMPTGYTRTAETYSIRGIDRDYYNTMEFCGPSDWDKRDMSKLYDLISAHYDIDLSREPAVRPLIQFVEYVRKNGNFVSYNMFVTDELCQKHNVLIVDTSAERKYLSDFYSNVFYHGKNAQFPDVPAPKRFAEYVAKQKVK